MKISYNWLKQYIDTNLGPEEISEILTQTGLEVEGVDRIQQVEGGLEGLVIGEVLEATQHPNADRLKVTRVNLGNGEPAQIVCGAPNVAAGQKVVVATVGATLYPSEGDAFKIKKSKIRGVESFGMICAEDEIGLGKSHDGIMVLDESATVGQAASEYFDLEDEFCIEIGLTPNRTDGMSHIGVARDLRAALIHMEGIDNDSPDLKWPSVEAFAPTSDAPVEVEVRNAEACPRYAGVCISGIKVEDSPEWLQSRLKSIGLSPINNVVDITNFVMHETGQPLHAFDQNKIEGHKVIVDTLPAGTKFVSLDEEERELDAKDLMICNSLADDASRLNDAGMCIGGVFGGIHSGVSESTTDVFLESAYFNPVYIRKSAKRHTLSTDASFRFERGVDPVNTLYVLKRAAMLICEIAGGAISSKVYDLYPEELKPKPIDVSLSAMNRLIGKDLPAEKVKDILQTLDFEIVSDSGDGLSLKAPLYRTDVTREADVVEEVLRIYGYNAIELPDKLNISLNSKSDNSAEKLQNSISDSLVARGFTEIMSNSLSQESYPTEETSDLANPETSVKILNPLSTELGIMRQALVFQGLETIRRNVNHKNADLRLFEFGRIYNTAQEGYNEQHRLAIYVTGKRNPESWNNADEGAGFPEIKGAIEHVLAKLGILGNLKQTGGDCSWLSQRLDYALGRETIAFYGQVNEELCKRFDVDQPVYYAEIDWDAVLGKRNMNKVKFKSLAKYPAVRRDLSLLIDESVEFAQISAIAGGIGKKLLKNASLFDVYQGKNLPKGKKSYAVSFVFQDEEATLKDKQIDAVMSKIIDTLKDKLSAELR